MSKAPSDGDLRWPGRGGNRAGNRIGEWLVAICCLGVVLFSPLTIRIFDRGIDVDVFGIPLLFFYLFTAWAGLVGLIAWVMESRSDARRQRTVEPPRPRPGGEGSAT
jgi:hypothetical protein